MASPARPAFLRLVHSVDDVLQQAVTPSMGGPSQGLFFPSTSPNTLIFADWGKTSLPELMDILAFSKPKMIFDFRITPRFDLDTLTRRRFFALLDEHGCKYIDLFGRVGISNVGDASANPILIAGRVGAIIAGLPSSNQGPFVFLHDDDFFNDDYIHAFANTLPAPSQPWQVFSPTSKGVKVPQTATSGIGPDADVTPMVRRTIFISHATPEDNNFVKWLAAKLTLAGYDVWSDITQLQGGDTFWNDIETAIRSRAAKVLFVYSQFAKNKIGTRKEVYLALKTGERLGFNRFVIPVRIDDTAFDETFIELIDIQAIDCRNDWLQGLKSILTLLERDNVQKDIIPFSDKFSQLVEKSGNPTFSTVVVPETLISSWLKIEQPPLQINFFACEGILPAELADVAKELDVPAFGHYALLATTANASKTASALEKKGLSYVQLSLRASIPWQDFVAAKWGDLPRVHYGEARRYASLLMNRAFSDCIGRHDTQVGTLANSRPFWFFRNDKFPKNEIRFVDHRGVNIRRQLVGFSNKRRVYWHFGIQERFSFMGDVPYFLISPHVTFSSNGTTPLASKAQLHSLRRSFCRSWWNKRWRDLLQGFVAGIADGSVSLRVDIGADQPLVVSSVFEKFVSPLSPAATEKPLMDSPIDDEIEDEWDEVEEPEFFEEVSDEEETEGPGLAQ